MALCTYFHHPSAHLRFLVARICMSNSNYYVLFCLLHTRDEISDSLIRFVLHLTLRSNKKKFMKDIYDGDYGIQCMKKINFWQAEK